MCWSEEVSWMTFTLGMITSIELSAIYIKRGPVISLITAAWQPVIWMQFFEALIWSESSDTGSYGAIYTALLQPPLMGLILLAGGYTSSPRRCLSVMIIIFYIYWYSYSLTQISPLKPLTIHSPECQHIDFAYWKDLVGADYMYAFTTSSLFLLLIPYTDLALFLILASTGTYCASAILYNCGESNGSMWCWFSSMMPMLVAGYWEGLR